MNDPIYKRASGFSLIEAVVALSLLALVFGLASQFIAGQRGNQKARIVGQQFAVVEQAVRRYARDNAYDIATNRVPNEGDIAAIDNIPSNGQTSSNGSVIDVLISENYIPDNFSSQNGWGSNYQVWVRGLGTDSNGKQLGFEIYTLVTGGQTVSIDTLSRAAVAAGGLTGYPAPGSSSCAAINPNRDQDGSDCQVRGLHGVWKETRGDIAPNIASPSKPIKLIAQRQIGQDQILERFLHRGRVPGRSDANTMSTTLALGNLPELFPGQNQDIFNGQSVQEGVYFGTVVHDVKETGGNLASSPGDDVIKPNCPDGSSNPAREEMRPRIFAFPQAVADDEGKAIHGFRVFAVDLGNRWDLEMKVETTDDQSTGVESGPPAPGNQHAIAAIVKCEDAP